MRASCVVPYQPVHELFVEGVKVIAKFINMPINKLFLHGTVKAFDPSVHLWCSWVIPIMYKLEVFTGCMEVVIELAAVVGLYSGDGEWGNLPDLQQKIRCTCARQSGVAIGKRKLTMVVDGRDDIPSEITNKFNDTVYLDKLTGLLRIEASSPLLLKLRLVG